MVEILKKEVFMKFDEAVKHVEKLVKAEGFSVLLVKNIDEVIKVKLGLESYPRYTIILACGSDLAKMALDVSKDVGTLFPCSFVVYEEEEKVIVSHVSIMKASVELNLVSSKAMAPVIKKTSEYIQAVWKKI